MKVKKTVVTTSSKKSAASKAAKPILNAKQESASTSAGKAKKSAPASAPASEPAPAAGINRGKSGMRVMEFQDWTFSVNDDPRRRYTDQELAQLWCEEFPNSRAVKAGRITDSMVRSVRHLYNNGTGGHGTQGVTHQSKPYVIENGKRVTSEYVRARKVTEPEAEAPKATLPAKGKAQKSSAAAPAAPVVRKGKKAA